MKPLFGSLVILLAWSAAGATAQTSDIRPPITPPGIAPTAPVRPAQPLVPASAQPIRPYRYMAPMGNQAMYTFEVLRTNKDELKLTDAQWKSIQDARDADQKIRTDRSVQTMNTRRDLLDLADADNPDLVKIEARVRELKKIEGDDMLADFKLTAAYRKALTPEQRDKIKTLSPKFEPFMPARPAMPGAILTPGAGVPPTPPNPPALPALPVTPMPRP